MSRQRLEELVRRTSAEVHIGGYILSTIDIDDVPGALCFVLSFLSKGKRPIYIYLDTYEDDEGRIVREVRRQLSDELRAMGEISRKRR